MKPAKRANQHKQQRLGASLGLAVIGGKVFKEQRAKGLEQQPYKYAGKYAGGR